MKERFSPALMDHVIFFRKLGQHIEQNPNLHDAYKDHPSVRFVTHDRDSTCLERVKTVEALAYGDPSVLLGAPGPSLSGVLLRDFGSEAQRTLFFDEVERESAKTFFAITEPNKGSDANHMESTLKRINEDEYLLNGEKWLIGNGAVANMGIILAKTNDGPLGINAVLLTPNLLLEAKNTIQREVLNTVFLKGAQLSRLKFENCRIPTTHVVGNHLRPTQRGLLSMLKTFNRMRPCVAAFALGHAEALIDFLSETLHVKSEKSAFFARKAEALRGMLYNTARQIDEDPFKYAPQSSFVKFSATRLVEDLAEYTLEAGGYAHLLSDPWLEKSIRDAYGFEFMEGTSNIQKLNAFHMAGGVS